MLRDFRELRRTERELEGVKARGAGIPEGGRKVGRALGENKGLDGGWEEMRFSSNFG